MNISIIGQGFVGLSLSVVLATKNFLVYGIENNNIKLSQLKKGKTPFYEPNLNNYLKKSLKKNKIHFYESIKEVYNQTDIIFITVPTPTINGKIKLQYLKSAIDELIPLINNNPKKITIVIKSTIAPNTTEKFIIPLLEKSTKKLGKDFFLAINPEFLREGYAIKDHSEPHVVVIGCRDKITKKTLINLYRKIYTKKIPLIVTNFTTAELIKYSNNAFLATKISFINSIANLCQKIPGANIDDVAKVIGMDPRIGGLFLNAGPGFGGSCLPKDLESLITVLKNHNVDSSLFEGVKKVNNKQTKLIISILENSLDQLKGKTISILGLAFKENSDDIRESKSISLIKYLLQKKCKIRVYDPLAIIPTKILFGTKITYYNTLSECVKNSNALVIMNTNKEFSNISKNDLAKMKYRLIIDTRRILKKIDSNVEYHAIGVNKR